MELLRYNELLGGPGYFLLLANKADGGLFRASVVYYTKRSLGYGASLLRPGLHTQIGASLDDAIAACLSWARERFGCDFAIGSRLGA